MELRCALAKSVWPRTRSGGGISAGAEGVVVAQHAVGGGVRDVEVVGGIHRHRGRRGEQTGGGDGGAPASARGEARLAHQLVRHRVGGERRLVAQHARVALVSHPDVARAVHRHRAWVAQRGAGEARRVARAHRHARLAEDDVRHHVPAGRRVHQHARVAVVGHVGVAGRVHRHPAGSAQRRGREPAGVAGGDGGIGLAEAIVRERVARPASGVVEHPAVVGVRDEEVAR